MTAVMLAEIGTECAAWCQRTDCHGHCRATIKVSDVKVVALLDETGLTVTLTADNGNQIELPHDVAQVIGRHIAATTDPASLPGGGAR